ncbi:MAG: preprotein translocase subunit SecY [Proteobacteria bacterium]|nr:preprotein translocase subunit SecY [Pseudomonadota bacterium]
MGLTSLASAARLNDLRARLLWVAGFFALFVLMVHIPVPNINTTSWKHLLEQQQDLASFLGMMTGGALNKFSIGAMGITPYINASIIMQLLTHVIPKLHDLQKEGGDMGRRQVAQYVRYLAIGLAFLQATMMTVGLERYSEAHALAGGPIIQAGWYYHFINIVALVAGTCCLMWMGEQMTDKGIGNGVSLIIMAGIVLMYPTYVSNVFSKASLAGPGYWIGIIFFVVISLALVAGIVALTQGMRKIPVQYAKRQVGRRVYGGQTSYLPIRVNNAGVISIIFAISIMYLPSTLARNLMQSFDQQSIVWSICNTIVYVFRQDSVWFNLMYVGLVIFFTYFYATVTFNPTDVADNMKKQGGFIPGIRPGRPTSDYLDRILDRLNFISGVALAAIAVLPVYVVLATGVQFYLGSTSLLIIVGVALDTMQQIEARLVMRNYQGFMKQ